MKKQLLSFASMFSDLSRGKRIFVGTLTGAIVLGLAITTPARAIGWPTFDFATFTSTVRIWKQDISTYAKIVQEYQQLVQIYNTEMAAYRMAVAMSQMVSHPQRLGMVALGPTFVNDMTQSRYGENQNWGALMNGQPGLAQGAWGAATLPLGGNPYLALEKLGSSALLARLATVEQIDGSSIRCSQVLAQYNRNQQQNSGAVALLKAAGLDISPVTNAMVAQLNLQNASNQQARMEQQSQGNIQACLAQQQMLANKQQRDIEVENLNFTGQVQSYHAAENDTWTDGATALQGFQLP